MFGVIAVTGSSLQLAGASLPPRTQTGNSFCELGWWSWLGRRPSKAADGLGKLARHRLASSMLGPRDLAPATGSARERSGQRQKTIAGLAGDLNRSQQDTRAPATADLLAVGYRCASQALCPARL
jgi:predicted component of type VI protein secretion system